MSIGQKYSFVLSIFLFLFCLRVLGQNLVASFGVTFLPPMDRWQSGLLPYPILLISQFLIILLFFKIYADLARGAGYFSHPNRGLSRFLLIFGAVYFGAMIVRYVIRMSLYPNERWVGGCIPIFFHFVLATFLIVLGTYHSKTSQVEL